MAPTASLFLTALIVISLAACSEAEPGTQEGPLASSNARALQSSPEGNANSAGPAHDSSLPTVKTKALPAAPPISEARTELLRLAFSAFDGMPDVPHVKNRCRGQDRVVQACLDLGQTHLALEMAKQISNWRRGLGYAGIAECIARAGEDYDLEPLLDLAKRAAEDAMSETNAQEWRRDRVRARMARAYFFAHKPDQAELISQGIEHSERGAKLEALATVIEESEIDSFLTELDGAISAGSFEAANSALQGCLALHDRFYANEDLRAGLEGRVEASLSFLPWKARLDIFQGLAKNAAKHGDHEAAGRHHGAVVDLLKNRRHDAVGAIAIEARLAKLLHFAGKTSEAKASLDAAMIKYAETKAKMQSIDRSQALLPIAEAYMAIGSTSEALATYARMIEAGTVNPNSRPRANDLAATLVSLATHDVPVPEAMRARLHEVKASLGAPW